MDGGNNAVTAVLKAIATTNNILNNNINSIKNELLGVNCPTILELKDKIDEVLRRREEYQRELKITKRKLDKYRRRLKKCEAELTHVFKLSVISIIATIFIVVSIIIIELNYGITIIPLHIVISLFALVITGIVLFYIPYTIKIKEKYHYSDLKEIVQSLSERAHKLENKVEVQTALYDEYIGKFSIRSYQLCRYKDNLISLTHLLNNLGKYLLDISRETKKTHKGALYKLTKIKDILERINGLTFYNTLLDKKYHISIKVDENLLKLIDCIIKNNDVKDVDGNIIINLSLHKITIPLGKAIYELFSTK